MTLVFIQENYFVFGGTDYSISEVLVSGVLIVVNIVISVMLSEENEKISRFFKEIAE